MTTAPTIADPLQAVLERLDGVKAEGTGQWSARCPAHEDRVASLSVSRGNDGRALIYCHAGCKARDIVERIGLRVTDLFAQAPPPSSNGQRQIVATYDYSDQAGVLLFQVVRYQPKDFRQRRPDAKGGWIWNLKGVERVLYRLQELIRASDRCTIYVTEGERDADRLHAEGMIATTNPGGAGKWGKVDSTPLHGRHVAIVPDHDEPGRRHAEDVATRLQDKAASVRIVELPGLPEHGDVSDWLDGGNDPSDLDQLASQASECQPATGKIEAKSNGRLRVVCMADVQPESIEWLWPHRFPLSKLSILAGMQGQGKSFVTLDMAARISAGTSWPDERDQSIELGSTIILSLEDGLGDTIRPRLNAAGADSLKIHAIPGVHKVDDSGERTFNVTRDVFLLEELIDKLADVRLVIVDPLTGYLGGQTDVHRDNEVRAALAPLGDLAARTGVSIIGVMHLRKAPSDQAMFRVLGSVAFTAYARACWLIGEDNEEPGSKLMLPVKLNVAKAAPGLRFEIVDPGRVVWSQQPVDATAEDVFVARVEHPDEAGPKVVAAAEWLQQALANGPQRATELRKQAGENCITPRTLDRAKARLGVVASNEGVFGQAWYWSLAESEPPLRERQA